MSGTATRNPRLPSLIGLRFVAAFIAFGFHVHAMGLFAEGVASDVVEALFGQGSAGVGFFFVLSGFVLTWSARPGLPVRTLWRTRAVRLLPNHLVTWLIALAGLGLLAGGEGLSLAGAITSMLLVQAWVPDQTVYFAMNTPSWWLSCEVAFCVAFPLLLRGIVRIREDRLWLTAGVLVACVLLVPVVGGFMPAETAQWFVSICPATRALEFILGIVLARIVLSGRWIGIGMWPASGLVVAGLAASAYVPPLFGAVAVTVVPLALLIPAAAVNDVRGGVSPWRCRSLVWLGKISFAFYLLHQLVIRFVNYAFGGGPWPAGQGIAIVAAMLVLTVVGSWALYRLVERPVMRRLATGTTAPAAMVRVA